MKFLVTGAHGFIGSYLVPALLVESHEVVVTDREDTDLSYPGRAKALIEGVKPDYVIHLAARYGRILCRDEPHRAVVDNTAATTELAAACARWDIPVLYTSSSEVYGDHGEDTITERSVRFTPTTIYGLSKRWGEEALALYLPADMLTIVRLNMLYGPEQRGGYGCCALATFIRDALEGRSLNVHVNATRSWLYITDAVEALALLIGKPGVWNLGNSHERMSMARTAKLVTDLIPGEMDLTAPPANQIRHKNYDTSKVEALGWKPTTSLEDGILKTVEWAQANQMRDYEQVAA